MAITNITARQTFQGTKEEREGFTGFNPGDEFFEIDTGLTYRSNSEGWWRLLPVVSANLYLPLFAPWMRSETVITDQLENLGGRGVSVGINVEWSHEGDPALTVEILGVDPTGLSYPLFVSEVITEPGFKRFVVYPSLPAVPNEVVNDVLPGVWQVRVSHGNDSQVMYAVGASVLA